MIFLKRLISLLHRTAEEKEDWIQVSVSHTNMLTHCAWRTSVSGGACALIENRISKDFLPTLIHCVPKLYSLIKPLIIAHLARAKLIKAFCMLAEERWMVGFVRNFWVCT